MRLIDALVLALYRQQFLLGYYGFDEKGVTNALALHNLVVMHWSTLESTEWN